MKIEIVTTNYRLRKLDCVCTNMVAWTPIDMTRNFLCMWLSKSPSNISPNSQSHMNRFRTQRQLLKISHSSAQKSTYIFWSLIKNLTLAPKTALRLGKQGTYSASTNLLAVGEIQHKIGQHNVHCSQFFLVFNTEKLPKLFQLTELQQLYLFGLINNSWKLEISCNFWNILYLHSQLL